MKTSELKAFEEWVETKYQLYSSLFLTLPFADLPTVGAELPIFSEYCRSGLEQGESPQEIVQRFFKEVLHNQNQAEQFKTLFLWLQFVERQVVLFDALEDAAFAHTHDLQGIGTLVYFLNQLRAQNKHHFIFELLKNYRTRIVLTAHPTQFYPPEVLVIIESLAKAVKKDNVSEIRKLLLQLGETPFKLDIKPTPLDEADFLIHHLENVLYPTIKNCQTRLQNELEPFIKTSDHLPALFVIGFWPGGDRDGNPNVTVDITCKVAAKLKIKIIDLYINEINNLKRRLTFRHIWSYLNTIENRLVGAKQKNNNNPGYKNHREFIKDLQQLRNIIVKQHQGLFVEKLDEVMNAVYTFQFYFAAIDIRQNSPVHSQVLQFIFKQVHLSFPTQLQAKCLKYQKLNATQKADLLGRLLNFKKISLTDCIHKNNLVGDVVGSLLAMQRIQQTNGENGCHRYVISNTQALYHVLEIMLLAKWSGWSLERLTIDIVPLFETIEDLRQAPMIMKELYQLAIYKNHLKQRGSQTIMLGFSDGTKDGGYITANWEILRCKQLLFQLAEQFKVDVIFFDGRGGPPARGGGNTHKFYLALGQMFQQKQIQLTIQGQTITSNFGTLDSAKFNIEQLFTAGLQAPLLGKALQPLPDQAFELLQTISDLCFKCYHALKSDPLFVPYLENITPLNYYGELNIASRPPRRKSKQTTTDFADLRAIPFVSAWAQMKQNIPGFYGIGTALQKLISQGYLEQLQSLYNDCLFFSALLENAMQSLLKSFIPLTAYLANDEKYGKFWKKLQQEMDLSITALQQVSGQSKLLANDPVIAASIQCREALVLPLLVIQQYAMMQLRTYRQQDKTTKEAKILHKIVLKSLAANINASRNSA